MKVFGYNNDSKDTPVLFDFWSIIHYLTGLIASIWLIYWNVNFFNGFTIWFLIHAIYEIKDLIWTRVNMFGFWNVSLPNSITDQIVTMLGFITPYVFKNVIHYSIRLHILWATLFFVLLYDLSKSITINL